MKKQIAIILILSAGCSNRQLTSIDQIRLGASIQQVQGLTALEQVSARSVQGRDYVQYRCWLDNGRRDFLGGTSPKSFTPHLLTFESHQDSSRLFEVKVDEATLDREAVEKIADRLLFK